jgi:uncharacterized protein YlxW (UPF0749 family)
MVAFIVLVVMIASVIRTAITGGRMRRRHREQEAVAGEDSAENARLRDEVKQLKERIQVLERITVEKENSLERQIEALRDR